MDVSSRRRTDTRDGKTHSGREELGYSLESYDLDLVVEERGGELKEAEGEARGFGQRGRIAEAEDVLLELGGEVRDGFRR